MIRHDIPKPEIDRPLRELENIDEALPGLWMFSDHHAGLDDWLLWKERDYTSHVSVVADLADVDTLPLDGLDKITNPSSIVAMGGHIYIGNLGVEGGVHVFDETTGKQVGVLEESLGRRIHHLSQSGNHVVVVREQYGPDRSGDIQFFQDDELFSSFDFDPSHSYRILSDGDHTVMVDQSSPRKNKVPMAHFVSPEGISRSRKSQDYFAWGEEHIYRITPTYYGFLVHKRKAFHPDSHRELKFILNEQYRRADGPSVDFNPTTRTDIFTVEQNCGETQILIGGFVGSERRNVFGIYHNPLDQYMGGPESNEDIPQKLRGARLLRSLYGTPS